jgi:hypothetical protein
MSQPLPEFSAELSHCDACSWPDADVRYVPQAVGITRLDRLNETGERYPTVAFLLRTCTRCDYEWAEALAAPVTAPQPVAGVRVQRLCDSDFWGVLCVRNADHTGAHNYPQDNSRCPSVDLGNQCENVAGHDGLHGDGHRDWPDQCPSILNNLTCALHLGHMGAHMDEDGDLYWDDEGGAPVMLLPAESGD